MFVVISVAALALFFNYLRTAFGDKFPFYGSVGDIVFLIIAIPLLFAPSRQKIVRWVRRSSSNFVKTGRVLILIVGYLILVMCAAYFPIELRTASTIDYIKPAVEAMPDLKPAKRIHVFSYGKDDATALVITEKNEQMAKWFVELKKSGKQWKVEKTERLNSKHNTFPPYIK